MFDPSAGSYVSEVPAPAWMGGAAIAGAITLKVVDWFLNRRGNRAQENALVAAADSSASLVNQLTARITALEARQAQLEGRVNEEQEARLQAQEESSRLRRRITALMAIMRHHKIEVPPEDHPEDTEVA